MRAGDASPGPGFEVRGKWEQGMSATLDRVQRLAKMRNVRISAHGYTRLAKRGILFGDVMSGVT